MNVLNDKQTGEAGYTLIEVLVAFVLLMIILVPLTQFSIRILTQTRNSDKINAVNLAESEMESCLLFKDFQDRQREITWNERRYQVRRKIERDGNLIYILVQVKRKKSKNTLISFSTIRIGN